MNSVAEHHREQPNRRLTRSAHGMIAGVCSGLSECWGVNLIFTRLAFVALGLFNGLGLALYVILVLVIPASPIAYAPDAGPVSPPRRSKKTAFACVAGLVSVCAGVLAFFGDLWYIFQFIGSLAINNR